MDKNLQDIHILIKNNIGEEIYNKTIRQVKFIKLEKRGNFIEIHYCDYSCKSKAWNDNIIYVIECQRGLTIILD